MRHVWTWIILWCLLFVQAAYAIGFLYPGIVLASSALYSGWGYLKCFGIECCNAPNENIASRIWIKYTDEDMNQLKEYVSSKLYGQPLIGPAVKAIRAHVQDENPVKPLVLSFHGSTGCGKNYLTQLTASSLYRRGVKSQFVHIISAPHMFPDQDPKNLAGYRVCRVLFACHSN